MTSIQTQLLRRWFDSGTSWASVLPAPEGQPLSLLICILRAATSIVVGFIHVYPDIIQPSWLCRWFDSGTSWASVLPVPEGHPLSLPADLYLEGSDQQCGWLPAYT